MSTTHNMKTTPLPPLSWEENSQLQDLFYDYWDGLMEDQYQRSFDSDTPDLDDYQDEFEDFYRDNGYTSVSMPDSESILDNDVHPIFGEANWILPFGDISDYHKKVLPALRLASKFLDDPHMLKWWIHLRYGQPGIERGWVGIKEDAEEHAPEAIENIRDELRKVAGKVKFTFLNGLDMEPYDGMCMPNLQNLRSILEKNTERARGFFSERLWYNPWDLSLRPTIVLREFYYWDMYASLSPGARLQKYFSLAKMLVHELAHACTMLWQPRISRFVEPLIQPTDHFPEAGLSWEQFAFGGLILTGDSAGTAICTEVDHAYPSTTPIPLPLSVPTPAEYITQWFLRDTWDHLQDRLGQLKVPTIRQQATIYTIVRLLGPFGSIPRTVLYLNGEDSAGMKFDDDMETRHQLTENLLHITKVEEERDHFDTGSQPISHENPPESVKDPMATVNEREASQPNNESQSLELTPSKNSKWPTTSAEVISLYERIWAKDVEKSTKMTWAIPHSYTKPHCYSGLTKLCCPYSQIDPDAELEGIDLQANEETKKVYFSPVHPCRECAPYCQSLYHEHKMPAVSFSQRLMTGVKLKRAHLRLVNGPLVSDVFVRPSQGRMRLRRRQLLRRFDRADLTLDDHDPQTRTPSLRKLFGHEE